MSLTLEIHRTLVPATRATGHLFAGSGSLASGYPQDQRQEKLNFFSRARTTFAPTSDHEPSITEDPGRSIVNRFSCGESCSGSRTAKRPPDADVLHATSRSESAI